MNYLYPAVVVVAHIMSYQTDHSSHERSGMKITKENTAYSDNNTTQHIMHGMIYCKNTVKLFTEFCSWQTFVYHPLPEILQKLSFFSFNSFLVLFFLLLLLGFPALQDYFTCFCKKKKLVCFSCLVRVRLESTEMRDQLINRKWKESFFSQLYKMIIWLPFQTMSYDFHKHLVKLCALN